MQDSACGRRWRMQCQFSDQSFPKEKTAPSLRHACSDTCTPAKVFGANDEPQVQPQIFWSRGAPASNSGHAHHTSFGMPVEPEEYKPSCGGKREGSERRSMGGAPFPPAPSRTEFPRSRA